MNASGFGFNGFSDPEKKAPKFDRYVNAAVFSVRFSLMTSSCALLSKKVDYVVVPQATCLLLGRESLVRLRRPTFHPSQY
jgi:hypothetical protein